MKNIKVAAIFGLLILVTACSKNGNVAKPKVNPITPTAGTNVYVAGFVSTGTRDIAMLWKNGVGIALTDATTDAEATAVYVSDTDVYVVGFIGNPTTGVANATLWKNGVASNIGAANTAGLTGVYVYKGDVYVSGNSPGGTDGTYRATMWKNGSPTYLPGSSHGSEAFGISGYDSLVCVAGVGANPVNHVNEGGYVSTATDWINGTFTPLGTAINEDNNDNAIPYSVFVNGKDIYMAGSFGATTEYDIAAYWKNGAITPLTNGTQNAEAYAIYVSGSDVYVAGTSILSDGSASIAQIWKNGVATALSTKTELQVKPTGVSVKGEDVYVAGNEQVSITNPHQYAKIWKNGVSTSLTDGSTDAGAYGIFVK